MTSYEAGPVSTSQENKTRPIYKANNRIFVKRKLNEFASDEICEKDSIQPKSGGHAYPRKEGYKIKTLLPIKSWELGWVMALVHCVNSAARPHSLAASFNYTCFEPKIS